jgi:hypothetical protein
LEGKGEESMARVTEQFILQLRSPVIAKTLLHKAFKWHIMKDMALFQLKWKNKTLCM